MVTGNQKLKWKVCGKITKLYNMSKIIKFGKSHLPGVRKTDQSNHQYLIIVKAKTKKRCIELANIKKISITQNYIANNSHDISELEEAVKFTDGIEEGVWYTIDKGIGDIKYQSYRSF